MQSFPSLPLLFTSTQSTRCHFFSPVFIFFSLPDSFLNPTSRSFFSFFSFFPQIPAGDCSWRGRRGQGRGLTLGSIDDLCLCVFVLCVRVCPKASLLFPVVWVRATWVGRRVAHSTKKISAASNWCTISPCRSRQPAVEWTENSLWWFPLLHWHSFTPRLLLPMYHSALISQTLGTILNNKVLVTYSQMCFWQMYNASCLLFSLSILHVRSTGGRVQTQKVDAVCRVCDRNPSTLSHSLPTDVWKFSQG